jgi:hypothetical protein
MARSVVEPSNSARQNGSVRISRPRMSSIAMEGWPPKGSSRLASSLRLLALLLVLHGAAQIGYHLPSDTLRPLLAALVPDSGPSVRPFGLSGHFPSLRSEARPLAGPPDRAPDQDPPAAILTLATGLPVQWTAHEPWLGIGEQPRHNAGRPFEARAPPTTA